MSSHDRYAMPSETDWKIPGQFDTGFRWEYDDGRDELLQLYKKGKKLQWDADDWRARTVR